MAKKLLSSGEYVDFDLHAHWSSVVSKEVIHLRTGILVAINKGNNKDELVAKCFPHE